MDSIIEKQRNINEPRKTKTNTDYDTITRNAFQFGAKF